MVRTKVKKLNAELLKQNAIIQVVGCIPPGYVSTYGIIASLAGFPENARYVGWVLSGLPQDTPIPWHRVINSMGKISLPSDGGVHLYQRDLLEAEGIKFCGGRVDMSKYCWKDDLREI